MDLGTTEHRGTEDLRHTFQALPRDDDLPETK